MLCLAFALESAELFICSFLVLAIFSWSAAGAFLPPCSRPCLPSVTLMFP